MIYIELLLNILNVTKIKLYVKICVTPCINITLFLPNGLRISINCIERYVKNNFDAECYYVGTTIRELCEARDNCCPQFLDRSDILHVTYH